jgi:hypothetical protein
VAKDVDNPSRCLALGVLANAMQKATHGDVEARQWLMGQDEWLDFWCDLAEIDIRQLRQRVVAAVYQDEGTA